MARYSPAALLFASALMAQSKPGVEFDQKITRVVASAAPGRGDSTINELHLTTTKSEMRIETRNNTLYGTIGPFSPGPHAILLTRDGGRELVFLNPDKKEFLSMKPLDMMEGMKKMLEGMGGSMTIDTSGTRITLDSVGPGPMIQGHPTLHYRLNTSVKMKFQMMGEESVVDNQSTQEMDVATDMGDFRDVAGPMSGLADISQSMGFGKEVFTKLAATQRRIGGVPLLIVKKTTRADRGVMRTFTDRIETRNMRRVTVPDSLFKVPSDYKSISMPALPGVGVKP